MSAEEQIERARIKGKMDERRRILEKLAQLELQGDKLKRSPKELARFFWGTN